MDPITLATGIIGLLKLTVAEIRNLTAKGEITVEEQDRILQEIEDIRSGKAFEGPEWKKSTDA